LRKEIIILTGYEHFFGQTRKPWVSLNTSLLLAELKTLGIGAAEYPFHKIANHAITPKNAIVFYTFSQRSNLRSYIKDVILNMRNEGNLVLPSYELLCCHENKGFQEIMKNKLGIDNLPAFYFSSKRELDGYALEFPLVLKTLEGSNGRGVYLIKTQDELLKQIHRLEPKLSLLTRLDLWRRKYLRLPKRFPGYEYFDSKKDFLEYSDYITPETGFVLQRFVPDLQYDYRVIILGKHYYVTKRLTRRGDFRASGAKRFTFDFSSSEQLLEYASDIFTRFDAPCLSIDVGESNGEYYLFEFQALHFGINAIVRGNGYYEKSANGWIFTDAKLSFEQELANSLALYLKQKSLI
jgi:glutathione synthase/RimK-type ligase-like ATP-grasp enzyme